MRNSLRGVHLAWVVVFLFVAVSTASAQSEQCFPAPEGLVAWWPGDRVADDIQGANEGTLQNGATFGTGMVDFAFSFDGVDDFVEIANTPSMDFGTGDFTIDVWINFNSLSKDQMIFHKSVGNVPNNNKTYFLEFNIPNALRFRVSDIDTNVNDLIVPTSLAIGEWHHIAAVRSGNTSSLYLDADLIGQQTSGNNVDTGTGGGARIGRTVFNGVNVNRPVHGLVDEVELFNLALNSGEIQAIFDAGAAGKCKHELIPTLSDWGLVGLVALLLFGGAMLVTRKLRPAQRS